MFLTYDPEGNILVEAFDEPIVAEMVLAAGGEFVAVSRLGQVRLAAERVTRALNGRFERQILEGMQRVVMDEDADRALGRQEMRDAVDGGGETGHQVANCYYSNI